MKFLSAFSSLLLILSLFACAGYQLGGTKPTALAHVDRLQVPLAKNSTQIPRAAAFVTNGVVDALVRDGTYRLGTADSAQARLEVEFHEVNFRALRTDRENRLRPEELSMTIRLRWKVVDSADPLKVLDSGVSTGRTTYFADANLQTAQQAALNDAIQRAAVSLVARLADGF
ncbi:LPS assembly lipoprotein LptE [Roseibacillus ishigakijimensis]|uniref:Lipopolysaccharide-assembly n=1 Tax=Roseibacillus ishigakijimensis TaxID=454146 RepID=A0A934RPD3_9BACT|nr:LPS assembly lipoprotein LptE [Roseibacillus ishigakijimensis]MBK1833382.1 hypothetical protein [Roseibacillus ishigakijimensis]